MAMDRFSLGRCLEALQLPLAKRQKLIERDARKAAAKERQKPKESGQDFYNSFWADAKKSAVNDDFDLERATIARIAGNKSRRNLYPRLFVGFGAGWERVEALATFVGRLELVTGLISRIKGSEDGDQIEIANMLAVRDQGNRVHLIYPYFSKDVALSLRHARIGIGAISEGFSALRPSTIAILDVLRGKLFAENDVDCDGTEKAFLIERYNMMMREWKVHKRYFLRSF